MCTSIFYNQIDSILLILGHIMDDTNMNILFILRLYLKLALRAIENIAKIVKFREKRLMSEQLKTYCKFLRRDTSILK